MPTTSRVALGISPGTRTVGIAIIRNNSLMDWSVKTFKGTWSKQKQKLILQSIYKIIIRHEVTYIALKSPHSSRYSKGLHQTIADLKALAAKEKIPIKIFITADFAKKHRQGQRMSIRKIVEHLVASQFPELIHDLHKKESKRNPYYTKAFEAILAAIQ